ncbi:hypothetical protein KKC65_00935 [Patescibacteria group bacterium]|nr:hypothetical protein [Patescibacteria group bacterium]
MINKKIIFFVSVFVFSFFAFNISAQEIKIDFFFSPTCPHCAEEEKFLDELEEKYSNIIINRYSVNEKANVDLLKEYYKEYDVSANYYGMVPATFTNENYFVGFNDKIGEDIERCIEKCKKDESSKGDFSIVDLEGNINVPIIGNINVKNFSLPILAVILGALDGFNVCSLGALVLILGLVLAIKSRKKTLLFGGIFILTTAIVYGLLIVIWYQIFSIFTPYMRLLQILIGLLGIGGGIYFFKQFLKFRKYGPTCEVTDGSGIVAKFTSKFQESLKNSTNTLLLLGGVLLFAGILAIIEFPCSAVIPVAFAGILAQSGLSTFQYLLYIGIFLLFYMLDEIIVFLIAFFTMKLWLASSKAITWITLLEALILFILGIYYIF